MVCGARLNERLCRLRGEDDQYELLDPGKDNKNQTGRFCFDIFCNRGQSLDRLSSKMIAMLRRDRIDNEYEVVEHTERSVRLVFIGAHKEGDPPPKAYWSLEGLGLN